MILRRVADLTANDNVRLEDGRLWNVASVSRADPPQGTKEYVDRAHHMTVRLVRTVGEELVLELRPDDLILLAI